MYGTAIDEILAAVRLMGARHDLDQGGLARAVLAAEGVDLTRIPGEAHIAQRFDAGKRFGDVFQLDEWYAFFRHKLTSYIIFYRNKFKSAV